MSRVHDALRRAEQAYTPGAIAPTPAAPARPTGPLPESHAAAAVAVADAAGHHGSGDLYVTESILGRIQEVPFSPSVDSHLIDANKPHEAPAEEFRTLRTRLNHLQTLQPISTLVVTSPSPAEGKSFAAVNLALAEAQLSGNHTLLVDCDFRRPIVHNLFQVERSPGMTDFLQGKARIEDCIKKVGGSGLYILPAGEAVINPLELLNLPAMAQLLDQLPRVFKWVILDSPPLLFAADANLLSTLSTGTVIVVRIGTTTIDSITRAMQSLCENNVLGIVVNGARRGELYSKYTYYHSYYYAKPDEPIEVAPEEEAASR
jgi:receptor protein-tyrosine kinase